MTRAASSVGGGREDGFTGRHTSLRHFTSSSFPLRTSATPHFSIKDIPRDDFCNVPDSVLERVGTNLHHTRSHPLQYILRGIEKHFVNHYHTQSSLAPPEPFELFSEQSPIVTVDQNFDSLLFPHDHVGRSPTDTYYLTRDTLLRTHTSAHQVELLRRGCKKFLVAGDVYRRDTVDKTHFPVFHQLEGVRTFEREELVDTTGDDGITITDPSAIGVIERDMKDALEQMTRSIFGQVNIRWVDAYFPFTHPSWEMEIEWENEWLEVLGCGVIARGILESCGLGHQSGWAFGLGLERLAMVLYGIPDIRLFWTNDDRFHKQFREKDPMNITFQPYSKYPECYKDVTFWVPDGFHENSCHEVVRDVAGSLAESVTLVDEFTHPKTNRTSHCYRINYRSMDRSLTNAEINELQERLRMRLVDSLGVELR